MEGVHYELDTEAQFWGELDEILNPVGSSSNISPETAIRNFINFTAAFRGDFLRRDEDVDSCCARLFRSELFIRNADKIRLELIALANEKSTRNEALYIIYWALLLDGQTEPQTLRKIRKSRCIPAVVDVIWHRTGGDFDLRLISLELMYEVSRSERLSENDLGCITEPFVEYLFAELEADIDENYNTCICRLILALNEQFMVTVNAETSAKAFPTVPNSPPSPKPEPVTNAVMQTLIEKGNAYKNFGQCIIFMLNREREMSLQLLILKLLYLIFTTPETYEYFYNNDLRVLVDVFIRELCDLPDDAEQLRHTYLRVLHPLLSHTQLRNPPHYKTDQLNTLLTQLSGTKSLTRHFRPIDQTTKRLVTRCIKVSWLSGKKDGKKDTPMTPTLADTFSNTLHISNPAANISTTSVNHVAGVKKPPPWVKTPRRRGKKIIHEQVTGGERTVVAGQS